MKRKTSEPDDVGREADSSTRSDKRIRLERPLRGNRGRRCKTYSANRKSVGSELLEDMGVNLIEDASNDSTASSESSAIKFTNISSVLKHRDTNIQVNTSRDNSNSDLRQSKREVHDESNSTLDCLRLSCDDIPSSKFLLYSRQRAVNCLPGDDRFNKMSDEVILLVFKWLPKGSLARCAAVCKRWCRLVKDDTLWRRLDLGLRTVKSGVLAQVVFRGCSILRLARSTIISPIFISDVSSHFTSSKLQFLDLSMATIQPSCLAQLIRTCLHLKKLALEHCTLNDDVCDGICQNENLDVLHLAMVTGLSTKGLSSILLGCKKLRELNISWTDLPASGLQVLSDMLPTTVDRLCLAGYRDTLQDYHVEKICSRCLNLMELDVSDAAQVTSKSLAAVVTNCHRLESLSTSRCYGITPTSYLTLVKLHSLLCLNIFGLLSPSAVNEIRSRLEGVEVNQYPMSSVARPTIGIKRTSIWNLRVRD